MNGTLVIAVLSCLAVGVLSQSACQSKYANTPVTDLELLKLADHEIAPIIKNRKFADLVYGCFLGLVPCDSCDDRAHQLLELLPWLFQTCIQNKGVCQDDARQRAIRYATAISQEYPNYYQKILQLYIQK